MTISSWNVDGTESLGPVKDRVNATLLSYLYSVNSVDQASNFVDSAICRLQEQLSIWVGKGGSQAIISRAAQLAEREYPLVAELRCWGENPAKTREANPNPHLSIDQARQCVSVMIMNVFVVVHSLTGNVLIDRLIKALAGDGDEQRLF